MVVSNLGDILRLKILKISNKTLLSGFGRSDKPCLNQISRWWLQNGNFSNSVISLYQVEAFLFKEELTVPPPLLFFENHSGLIDLKKKIQCSIFHYPHIWRVGTPSVWLFPFDISPLIFKCFFYFML